jgi:hypothetical protein
MTEKDLVLSPTEIKLILRLRQLANNKIAEQVLLNISKMTISVIKAPETLKPEN